MDPKDGGSKQTSNIVGAQTRRQPLAACLTIMVPILASTVHNGDSAIIVKQNLTETKKKEIALSTPDMWCILLKHTCTEKELV